MAGSKLFRDYQRAFEAATGLLPELGSPQSSFWAESADACHDSPCVRLGLGRRSCAACLYFQQKLAVAAEHSGLTREWHACFCETVVPVRTGNRVIALLHIGQVRLRAPTDNDVQRVVRLSSRPRPDAAAGQVRAALWQTRYIDPARYASLIELLEFFSHQLSDWYVRNAPTKRPTEPDAILRTKEWIETHYHEPLTLARVAQVAQMSSSHFCRIFHRTTGLKFREFLSRMRIARVRQLLADPHNAIAESALAVGFQSVSQFNRTFHKLVGQSPSEYRATFLARRPMSASATIKSQGLASPLSDSDAA
jgi:AraC-like DNA-binding protein